MDGGFLFVVHQVFVLDDLRHYLHRFVLLDRSLSPRAASPAFSFTGRRVEFCAGLARRDDDLLVAFGVDDAHAIAGVVREDDVLRLLDAV